MSTKNGPTKNGPPQHRPLRIGLDLRGTEPGFKAHFGRGTGRYIDQLVAEFKRQSPQDFDLIYAGAQELGAGSLARCFRSLVPVGRTTIEQQLLLPRRISKLGVDSFHFFAHGDAPTRCPVPYVTTVLDLIPLKFPHLYKATNANWRFKLARYLELQAIRNAHGIIAISECTKRDLVSMLGISPDRIVVTYLGLSEDFLSCESSPVETQTQVRQKLGLSDSGPIFLYVGGIDPRKNVPFLFTLLSELRDPRARLLLIGRYDGDKHFPSLLAALERSGVRDQVTLLGYVSDEQLKEYYRAADVFLFPSLYEGFGLPILESFAHGLPVICGDNSCMGEVAGEAALLCEDGHLSAWVRALRELLSSGDLQRELRARGHRQQSKFRWSKTAENTLEAYRYFFDLPSAKASKLHPTVVAAEGQKSSF